MTDSIVDNQELQYLQYQTNQVFLKINFKIDNTMKYQADVLTGEFVLYFIPLV